MRKFLYRNVILLGKLNITYRILVQLVKPVLLLKLYSLYACVFVKQIYLYLLAIYFPNIKT